MRREGKGRWNEVGCAVCSYIGSRGWVTFWVMLGLERDRGGKG